MLAHCNLCSVEKKKLLNIARNLVKENTYKSAIGRAWPLLESASLKKFSSDNLKLYSNESSDVTNNKNLPHGEN